MHNWRQRQVLSYSESSGHCHCHHHRSPLPHSSILLSLDDPTTLRQLHARLVSRGLSRSLPLCNRLIKSYASFGLINYAVKTFRQIPMPNIFSWTNLISGYTKNGLFLDAVNAFWNMVDTGLLPNEVTVASTLPAFANLDFNPAGRAIHGFWLRHGFPHNVVVETSLVYMYCRYGLLAGALKLFVGMPKRTIVSWNVIISGYAENRCGHDAIFLFNLMRQGGFSADYFTITSLISASLSVEHVGRTGSVIHGYAIRIGYAYELRVQTALVRMYLCGQFTDNAHFVFDEMTSKDVKAWTVIIAGFSRMTQGNMAMKFIKEMWRTHNLALDHVAVAAILSSCGHSGALVQGRTIHSLAIKKGVDDDVFVSSALINMYAKCGDIGYAKRKFAELEDKDIACWNALISALGMHGGGDEAVDLFLQMRKAGAIPNESTFVSVLCACSHAGLVDEGLRIFDHMVNGCEVVPNLQHYVCVVDLLGRSGGLDDAYSLIENYSIAALS